MWLLVGRYAEVDAREESKLLRYDTTYTIGRKVPAADIPVDSKFVSRKACQIIVDDAPSLPADLDPARLSNDSSCRPKVIIRFEPSKNRNSFIVRQMPRGSNDRAESMEVHVEANEAFELRDQDAFALTTTISLRLVWKPLAVCFGGRIKEPAIAPLRSSVTKLGIYLSPAKTRWSNGYTHLCVDVVKPTASVIEALVQACPVVNLDYVGELLRLGNLSRHDPKALETSYVEPDLALYTPKISAEDLEHLAGRPDFLHPDQKRTYTLKGTTCVFLISSSDQAQYAIYSQILLLAGARVHCHNIEEEHLSTKADFASLLMPYKNSAMSYWRNSGSLSRPEAPNDGLVVLCSSDHAATSWHFACTVACAQLQIAMPAGFHVVSDAVFTSEVREHFNVIPANPETHLVASSQPEIEPAEESVTRMEQPAEESVTGIEQFAEGTRSDREEVVHVEETSAATSQEPVPSTQTRRTLKRRTQKEATNEDEPRSSAAVITHDSQHEPVVASQSHPVEGSKAHGGRLTRRTGANRTTSAGSDAFGAISTSVHNRDSDSNTNAETAKPSTVVPTLRSHRFRKQLDEQDKAESQALTQTIIDNFVTESGNSAPTTGQKRKMQSKATESIEQATSKRARTKTPQDSEYASQSQGLVDEDMQPTPVSQTISRRASDKAAGLVSGAQPDSEPQFLQAISTQRAKGKGMDSFDTEFNNLKIARPNQLNDREAGKQSTNLFTPGQARRLEEQSQAALASRDEDFEAFKKLAHEELRIHVRGNFVQVDFVPLIYRKEASTVDKAIAPNGAPNFKKFRPKPKPGSTQTQSTQPHVHKRAAISLALTKTHDYGLGDAYWKDSSKSNAPVLGEGGRLPSASRRRDGISQRRQRETSVVNLSLSGASDDDDVHRTTSARTRRHFNQEAIEDSEVDELQSSGAINLDLDSFDSLDELDDVDMTTMLKSRSTVSTAKSNTRAAPARGTTRAASSKGTTRAAPARGTKRAAPSPMEESDEEIQVCSTGKRPAVVDLIDSEDDSDDGSPIASNGNFAGFGQSTRSSRGSRNPPTARTPAARRGRSARQT